MKKQNILAVCAVVAALLGSAFFLSDLARPITRERAPDFAFMDTNRQNRLFYNITNKRVIVHFWATWCAPCLAEIPQLFDMVIANPDVTLIAVSVDTQVQSMRRFLNPLPRHERIIHVWDDGRELAARFNVTKFPETFIFDSHKYKLHHIRGVADWPNFRFGD